VSGASKTLHLHCFKRAFGSTILLLGGDKGCMLNDYCCGKCEVLLYLGKWRLNTNKPNALRS
jgi:hypothetical protein